MSFEKLCPQTFREQIRNQALATLVANHQVLLMDLLFQPFNFHLYMTHTALQIHTSQDLDA